MELHEHRHYEVTRLLLSLIGQWPYDESKSRYLATFVISMTVTSFGLVQIFRAIACTLEMQDIVNLLTCSSFTVLCIVKYATCWINKGIIKSALDHMQANWNELRSEEEIEVMRNYTDEGWYYGKMYLVYIYSILFGFLVALMVPLTLDIALPQNVSRVQSMPFEFEYFINMDGREYLIIMHIQCAGIAGVCIIAAADVLYILLTFHSCAMYNVISFRLEHLFDDMQNISSPSRVFVLRKRVMRAVDLHLKCIEYLDISSSCYVVSYVIQFFIIIIALACRLVNIQNFLSLGEDFLLIAFIFDLMGHYFVLFMTILPGQRVVDDSANLFYNTCSGCWYDAPVPAQKLLLFILQKTEKPRILGAGGVFLLNMNTFGIVIRVSFSYFMALTSLQT